MALIAPGVARFTLNGTNAGSNTWANIWDARMLGDVAADRAEACSIYAQLIIDVWSYSISSSQTDDVTLTSVSWVDLDSAEGSTGSQSLGFAELPPYVGAQSGAGSPLQVSVLAIKGGSSQRGSRNGRMFIPGIPEADADEANMASGPLGVLNDRLETFLFALTDPSDIPDFSVLPCVVHTRNVGTPQNPEIEYVSNSVITSLQAVPRLATQRRRLRR